jgi:hypothetical protein
VLRYRYSGRSLRMLMMVTKVRRQWTHVVGRGGADAGETCPAGVVSYRNQLLRGQRRSDDTGRGRYAAKTCAKAFSRLAVCVMRRGRGRQSARLGTTALGETGRL